MNRVLSVSAAFLIAASSAASAAPFTFFTDRAAFLAAAGPVQTEDFNSAPLGQFAFGTAYAFNGFTVTGAAGAQDEPVGLGISEADEVKADGTRLLAWTQAQFGGSRNGPTITYAFDAPILAFGFDWVDRDSSDIYALRVLGTLIGDGADDVPFPRRDGNARGFFGLISGAPFSSLELYHVNAGGFLDYMGMDNVVLSEIRAAPATNPIPVPASLPLLALALGGLLALRRRR